MSLKNVILSTINDLSISSSLIDKMTALECQINLLDDYSGMPNKRAAVPARVLEQGHFAPGSRHNQMQIFTHMHVTSPSSVKNGCMT